MWITKPFPKLSLITCNERPLMIWTDFSRIKDDERLPIVSLEPRTVAKFVYPNVTLDLNERIFFFFE